MKETSLGHSPSPRAATQMPLLPLAHPDSVLAGVLSLAGSIVLDSAFCVSYLFLGQVSQAETWITHPVPESADDL